MRVVRPNKPKRLLHRLAPFHTRHRSSGLDVPGCTPVGFEAPLNPLIAIVSLAWRARHRQTGPAGRCVFEDREKDGIKAAPRLRSLLSQHAMNREPDFGPALARDSVSKLLYDEWINVRGVQLTFAPGVFLQDPLCDA